MQYLPKCLQSLLTPKNRCHHTGHLFPSLSASHLLLYFEKVICNVSYVDPVLSSGTVYSVEHENGEEFAAIEQSLTLFLFLQHRDPFTIQLSDVMGESQLDTAGTHCLCALSGPRFHALGCF